MEKKEIMNFAYIRVSTDQQTYERQRYVLKENGYTEENTLFFEETYTGGVLDKREALHELITTLPQGATLVVESFSRLARSTKDLLSTIELVESKGASVKSIKESLDTSTPTGRMLVTIISAVDQFEKDVIAERTREALASKKAKGVILGRPAEYDHQAIIEYYLSGDKVTYDDINKEFGISKSAISNIMKKNKVTKTRPIR